MQKSCGRFLFFQLWCRSKCWLPFADLTFFFRCNTFLRFTRILCLWHWNGKKKICFSPPPYCLPRRKTNISHWHFQFREARSKSKTRKGFSAIYQHEMKSLFRFKAPQSKIPAIKTKAPRQPLTATNNSYLLMMELEFGTVPAAWVLYASPRWFSKCTRLLAPSTGKHHPVSSWSDFFQSLTSWILIRAFKRFYDQALSFQFIELQYTILVDARVHAYVLLGPNSNIDKNFHPISSSCLTEILSNVEQGS